MARQQPVLPHLSSVAKPGACFGWRCAWRSGSVLRREPESGEGAVVGDLLKRFGKPLEALAVVHRFRRLEETLPASSLLRVFHCLQRRAAGEREPAVRVGDAFGSQTGEGEVGWR